MGNVGGSCRGEGPQLLVEEGREEGGGQRRSRKQTERWGRTLGQTHLAAVTLWDGRLGGGKEHQLLGGAVGRWCGTEERGGVEGLVEGRLARQEERISRIYLGLKCLVKNVHQSSPSS